MDDVSPRDLLLAGCEVEASFWDCLFSRREDVEIALLYSKAVWPELLEVDGFILLAENYDRDYFEKTLDKYGESLLEATINTTYLMDLFGASEAKPEVVETVGLILIDSWHARATKLFPSREFVAHFDWFSLHADPGVVLHQRRWSCPSCGGK